jgi:hypothetical protein
MRNKRETLIIKCLLISGFLSLTFVSFSQTIDSIKAAPHFGGSIAVTNNGISFIPNFTLGKPAAIFDMVAGKGKLSFEPQFRFALTGKPWSFVFWWRYKLLTDDKLKITIGAHPSTVFKSRNFMVDGVSKEFTTVQRFIAGELAPNYYFTKNINAGIYYMYSYCLSKDAAMNTNFLALRLNFTHIKLSEQYSMRFNPQVYYLKMDNNEGYYYNAALTLARKAFPFSVSALINQPIKTTILSEYNFLWNVSLIYSFNKEYVEK